MRALPIIAGLLLAGAMAAPAPAATEAAGRIINGHAPTRAWPAQTSVRFTISSGTYVCGGTLLSARWVLSAGHCASDDNGDVPAPSAFNLRVGSTSRTSDGHQSAVDEVVRHPAYSMSGTPRNDLALLHLATAAPQEPLRLIGTGEGALWSAGTQATIIGWGVTETGSGSPTLLEAQVPMVSDAGCRGTWGSLFSSTSMVCAGGAGADSCGGDSGGPIMVPRDGGFALVGATSWGASPCGQAAVPGAYARVGDGALNAWVRSRVPGVTLSASPAAPVAGQQVTLTAVPSTPAGQSGSPALAWDTDDDGAFDDGAGPSATATFAGDGGHVVRVRSSYPDGDRAVTRELVTVGGGAAAPSPPPPPAPAPPAGSGPGADGAAQPAGADPPVRPAWPEIAPELAGTVSAPARIRFGALRTRHLRVRFTCADACTVGARLRLGARTARRLRLTSLTIGRGRASRASAGAGTIVVRLTDRARRVLRGRARSTIYLRTTLTTADAVLAPTHVIAVRR